MEPLTAAERLQLALSSLVSAIYPADTTPWTILASAGWPYELQQAIYERHLTRFHSRLLFFWHEIVAAEISPWAAYAIFREHGLGPDEDAPSIAEACGWTEHEYALHHGKWLARLTSDRCRRLLSRFAGIAALEIFEADCLRVVAPAEPAPAETLTSASAHDSNRPRSKLLEVEEAAFEFATEHPEGSYRTTIARLLIGSHSKKVTHLQGHRLFGRFRFLSRQVVMFVLDNMIDTGRLQVLEEPSDYDLDDW